MKIQFFAYLKKAPIVCISYFESNLISAFDIFSEYFEYIFSYWYYCISSKRSPQSPPPPYTADYTLGIVMFINITMPRVQADCMEGGGLLYGDIQ